MQISDFGKLKYAETKRQIRNAMSEHQLVLFVGAGASVKSGMPLWSEAVDQIANKLSLGVQKEKLDKLVIPQYYYNARGRKEYTQLMREIFHYDDKLIHGNVHDAIIRFDTETIITTNYDHLIEQAAESNGEFFYVVSQDSDLPYRKAGKELIKMHGDFEHGNFVLKEDDYLHYHKNFKLIENYVKSLIGTKTVLFVGYSLGDPDVKHIFSWVKEVLDEHFQRAYLIVTGRNANQNEEEYFKHLGVNSIYATELFVGKEIDGDNHYEQLLLTLNYILDDEEKEKGIIDSLYDYLKPFNSLNYTYRNYIERAFNRLRDKVNEGITLRLGKDGFITYSDTIGLKDDHEFLEELGHAFDDKSTNSKVRSIADALRKGDVRGIRLIENEGGKKHYKKISFADKDIEPGWIEAIRTFNYQKLNQLKELNAKILSESKPGLYLQQAYICSFLGDYLSAYYCLDNAANFFYRKREYSWYFISVWNKRTIAQIISIDFIYRMRIPPDILEVIKNDYDTCNLDKTLQTIPDLGNDNNRFLRDLKDFKFASDLFYDVVSNTLKTSAQANETYSLFAGMPAYEEMRQLVYDYYRYGIYNCLIVDKYRENNEIYNLFVRGIFTSVSAPDKDALEETIFGSAGNVHAKSLNVTDVHLIIRYIKASKLRKLLEEFNINILEIDESCRLYLKILIKNIPAVFDLNVYNGADVFWRLICLISHTEIDEILAKSVLLALKDLSREEYRNDCRDFLMSYLNAIYTQKLYEKTEISNAAKQLLSTLIDIISESKDCLQYYRTSIISLIFFCDKGSNQFDDENSIRKILSDDYYLLLAQIYRGCAVNIKKIIENEFDQWNCPDSGAGYRIYSESVLSGIKEPDKAVEQKAFDYLVQRNADKKKELERGIQILPVDNIETYLIDLYLSDLIIDADRLKKIILKGDNKFAKWLVDKDSFDYGDFELSWLKLCSPSLLEKLAKNIQVKEAVISIFKENYASEYIDQKTTEAIITYFI